LSQVKCMKIALGPEGVATKQIHIFICISMLNHSDVCVYVCACVCVCRCVCVCVCVCLHIIYMKTMTKTDAFLKYYI